MTKRTEQTMTAICDTIASGILSYQKAALMNGVAARTFWLWIKLSQQNDESLMMTYLSSRVQFAQAINAARRIALHEMRGRMEQKSILGWDEAIFFSGMPTWQPDPVTVGWTEDEREAFGFRRDGLLEVDGKVVQNVLHHEPPVALQLRVAEMAFPKEYRPGISSTVEVNHSGVVGIQHAKPVNYSAGPPAVPPPPVLPPAVLSPLGQLEVLNTPDELQIPETGPEDDIDLDAMLGPAPPSAPPPVEERVIVSAPTAAETPPPQVAPLAPPPSTSPGNIPAGWRQEWEKLQARAALADKLNRG